MADRSVVYGLGSSGELGFEGVTAYTSRLSSNLPAPWTSTILDAPTAAVGHLARWRRALRRADVAHLQLPCYQWRYSLAPAWMAAAAGRTPLVVTVHEWGEIHPLRRRLFGWVFRRARQVVFVSDLVRSACLNSKQGSAALGKDVLIPIGVNVETYVPEREEAENLRSELLGPDGGRLFLQFGNIYEGKQPFKVLEAFCEFKKLGGRGKLVFIGSAIETGDFRPSEFESACRGAGGADDVLLLGGIRDEALIGRYVAASDAVFALYSDGLSARRSTFWYTAQFGTTLVTTNPASEGEFASMPGVRDRQGILWFGSAVEPRALAQAMIALPDYQFMRYPPIPTVAWSDVGRMHAEMYSRMLENAG